MDQVLDSIEAVKDKRPRQPHLNATLDQERQRRESRRHGSALQVPARQRRDQVADAVGVQATSEDHAGETLEDGRAKPGLVLVVDLEVGRDGPSEALLRKEGLRLAGRHGLGGCGAAGLENGCCRCEEVGWFSGCELVSAIGHGCLELAREYLGKEVLHVIRRAAAYLAEGP